MMKLNLSYGKNIKRIIININIEIGEIYASIYTNQTGARGRAG